MLRISKGQEERHVWPVPLPGWLDRLSGQVCLLSA
jgi:hypothetical protein